MVVASQVLSSDAKKQSSSLYNSHFFYRIWNGVGFFITPFDQREVTRLEHTGQLKQKL